MRTVRLKIARTVRLACAVVSACIAITGLAVAQVVPPAVEPGRLPQQFQPPPTPPKTNAPLIIVVPSPQTPPPDIQVTPNQTPSNGDTNSKGQRPGKDSP